MSILPAPQYRNQNPPAWFVGYRDQQQAVFDDRYLHSPVDTDSGPSVDTYNAAAKDWIDNQVTARNILQDPASFIPAPFTRGFPRRRVCDIQSDGFTVYAWAMDPDPNIHPPVLPPYVAPAPTGGFKTTAPTAADDSQWKGSVMAALSQINAKLDALKKGA